MIFISIFIIFFSASTSLLGSQELILESYDLQQALARAQQTKLIREKLAPLDSSKKPSRKSIAQYEPILQDRKPITEENPHLNRFFRTEEMMRLAPAQRKPILGRIDENSETNTSKKHGSARSMNQTVKKAQQQAHPVLQPILASNKVQDHQFRTKYIPHAHALPTITETR